MHVPVTIELVIDIATDIYKPGHDGHVLTLGEKRSDRLANGNGDYTAKNCRVRAMTLAQLQYLGSPSRAKRVLPYMRAGRRFPKKRVMGGVLTLYDMLG